MLWCLFLESLSLKRTFLPLRGSLEIMDAILVKVNECKDKFQSEKLAYQVLDGVLLNYLWKIKLWEKSRENYTRVGIGMPQTTDASNFLLRLLFFGH
ncbi:hypothetical protein SDJN02_24977, partial [Cucurbita argyrosperma subsp. argyrosperma]